MIPRDAWPASSPLAANTARLSPAHLTMLRDESGIADEVIAARGYRSIDDPGDLQDLGFSKAQARTAPVMAIPIWDVHRQQISWQIRPDHPRQLQSGKVFKYEIRKGDRLILDVPPTVHPLLADPKVPLWITEGVRKGDAVASRGACVISLVGGVGAIVARMSTGAWSSCPTGSMCRSTSAWCMSPSIRTSPPRPMYRQR